MMITQNFKVTPKGIIKNGKLQLAVDPSSGDVAYVGSVTAGWWLFTKTIPLSGTYKIDPALLLSANCKPGKVINLGLFSLTVTSLNAQMKSASCNVKLTGDNPMHGSALLGLGYPQIRISSIDVTGKVSGYDVHLVIKAVP